MPRSVSVALQSRLASAITDFFYLIQINASQVLRWSNGGEVTVSGVIWTNVDFKLDGFDWEGGAQIPGRLRAQNFDNALGAFFMNEAMADVTVDVYQVERTVLTDPQYLGRWVLDDTNIGLDFLETALMSSQSANATSPRRTVDTFNGFFYALPVGTQIPWGNEIFILGANNNG